MLRCAKLWSLLANRRLSLVKQSVEKETQPSELFKRAIGLVRRSVNADGVSDFRDDALPFAAPILLKEQITPCHNHQGSLKRANQRASGQQPLKPRQVRRAGDTTPRDPLARTRVFNKRCPRRG
jgi:hypothetical protein